MNSHFWAANRRLQKIQKISGPTFFFFRREHFLFIFLTGVHLRQTARYWIEKEIIRWWFENNERFSLKNFNLCPTIVWAGHNTVGVFKNFLPSTPRSQIIAYIVSFFLFSFLLLVNKFTNDFCFTLPIRTWVGISRSDNDKKPIKKLSFWKLDSMIYLQLQYSRSIALSSKTKVNFS
jgi:hypothetical protein